MLVVDDVVGEDRVGGTALHVLERGEAHRFERRAVRVQDVMVGVANRHRLGERIEDLAEPGVAPAQLRLELAQQLRALGHVVDPGVEQRLAALPDDGDRHLDRKLAAVPAERLDDQARPDRRRRPPPSRPRDATRRDAGRGSARERSARPARTRAPPHASNRTARWRGDSTRALCPSASSVTNALCAISMIAAADSGLMAGRLGLRPAPPRSPRSPARSIGTGSPRSRASARLRS